MYLLKSKKILLAVVAALVLISFIFTLSIIPKTAKAADAIPDYSWYNDADSEATFEISNANQLAGLAVIVNNEMTPPNNLNKKTFKLTSDINLSSYGKNSDYGGWTPIGDNRDESCRFTGKFDGNGYKITGLYIKDTDLNHAGLFGYVNNATIKNLSVSCEITGKNFVGGIAGLVIYSSTVLNCSVEGSVTGNDNIGGIAGSVAYSSKVDSCYSIGTIYGSGNVGGISGQLGYGSSIVNSYSAGTVSGMDRVSGIAALGNNTGNKIENCAALNSSVTADHDKGRVAGTNITLTNNIAFADMSDGTTKGANFNGAKTLTGRDGENITQDNIINGDGTFGGRFSGGLWKTAKGKFPGFGAALNLPVYLMADGAAVSAPELDEKTANSITIKAVTAPSNGQTVEYAISETSTAPAEGWQTGLSFTGLKAGTDYYIFARAADNGTYKVGAASAALQVTTDKEAGGGLPEWAIILMAAGGGAILLSGVIVLVVCLVVKSKNKGPKSGNPKKTKEAVKKAEVKKTTEVKKANTTPAKQASKSKPAAKTETKKTAGTQAKKPTSTSKPASDSKNKK